MTLCVQEGKDTKSITWSAKGPGGSVIIIEVETENMGKSRQEILATIRKNQ